VFSYRGRSARWVSLGQQLIAVVGTFTIMMGLLSLGVPSPAYAGPKHEPFPKPAEMKRVPLGKAKAAKQVRAPKSYAKFDPAGAAELPGAETVTIAPPSGRTARAGKTPVSLSRPARDKTPSRVKVRTVDQRTAQAAGVTGLLFTLEPAAGAGAVDVDVDSAAFRNVYGGGFASRLRLVSLPACAVTTPEKPDCRTQTPVTTEPGQSLSAKVALSATSATVLAATSGEEGPEGDYSATSLSPGGTWSMSGNTGGFTYSYPIVLPPSVAGDAPEYELNYNSSSQDARTAGTNNQSSWVGDGWTATESYIERTYKGCKDVTGSGAPTGSGDICWAGELLTLSLSGKSTPIVYDDDTKTFHPADDESTTKIERLTGTTNGTKNGEHFRVTMDGTEYWFGLNHLPGWTSGKEETKSAYTVPVYKANGGVSACPAGDFADTACTLGYRFNLDYVVDRHSNAMAYYYTPEVGHYGAEKKKTAVPYIRDGYLKRIDYGMRASTIHAGAAPAQVLFNTAERCIVGRPAGNSCSDEEFTVTHPEYWPDTPVDLNCVSGKDCTKHGASFWSRKRLTSIVTQVQVGGVTKQVDRYDLTQTFPDGGDHAPTLWLESIKRTGLDRLGGATADTSAGAVTFYPIQLPNRVGTVPGLPRMYHNRIVSIESETGALTTVDYSTPDCSSVPASDLNDEKDTKAQEFASTNATGCFPVYWAPEGQPRPLIDWFYTHPISRVTTIDRYNRYQDGSQPTQVTEYAYKGKPGWRYDDNELVKAKNRTWGQFRGYPEVETRTGDPNVFHWAAGKQVHDRKTLTKTYYFLGMNGDKLPGDGTRSVPALESSDGTITVPDDNRFAGQEFEKVEYTGDGGTVDSSTVTVPTVIGPTASRARTGLPAQQANMVRTARKVERQKVSYGWRTTETRTFYNTTLGQSTTGMEVQKADRGEVGATGNVTKCIFSRYIDGTVPTLVLPAQVLTTTQDCAAAGATPSGTLISETRTAYDGNPFARNGDGQANPARPSRGNVTLTQEASAASGVTATAYVDVTSTGYDEHGRVVSSTRTPNSKALDGVTSLAKTVLTRFTPASGALPTKVTTITPVKPGAACASVTVSSADCQVSWVVNNPARHVTITEVDGAGSATSMAYDALGRLTSVWLANKDKDAGAAPSMTHEYATSATGPTVVTTKRLLDDTELGAAPRYKTSKVLYDAMLRELEQQDTGENGVTVVDDTQYDSHGRAVITNNAYAVTGSPRNTLISDQISQVTIPASTATFYDGQGQVTQVTEQHNGAEKWSTRTAYTGDKTTTIPPDGGVANTKTVDARDQLVEFQQYTTRPTLTGNAATGFTATGGTAISTKYGYTPSGKQAKVTGADGAVWTWSYDLRGRETSRVDPDAGSNFQKFDDAGNLTAVKDSRGIELNFTYDLAGRKLTAVNKTKDNFKFASWEYDTLRIGKLTSSTRYVNDVTGGYKVAVTGYSTLGKPLGQTITLPSSEAPLPVSYTNTFQYTQNTEELASNVYPAVGGLPGETITYGRTLLGAPARASGIDLYVSGAIYTDFGQLSRVTMGASSNEAQVLYSYDEYTLRLAGRSVHRSQGIGPLVDETKYTYDDSGNPLSVTNEQSETGNTVVDAQCYRYDGLNRLVEAWTAATACPTASTARPAAGSLATGPGAYWQSFAYNEISNRTKLTEHSVNGGADAVTDYTNGCSTGCNRTGAQPHTLTAMTGAGAATFTYDVNGNMLTRTPANGAGQKLTWDDEGYLEEVTTTTGTTTATTRYLYDADGNQLIRRDPGKTTLFAGDTQVVINTSVTPAVSLGAVRTYTLGGSGHAVAVRSTLPGGGTHYLLNDTHGTGTLAIDTTTQTVSRQQIKPYGESRAKANPTPWPDQTRGYLGKPTSNATGYSDLGARKYDPALGRFISADPVLDASDPNQLGGYTYSGSNPILSSDPGGKMLPPEDRVLGRDATGKKTGGSNTSSTPTTGGSRTPSTPSGGTRSYNVPVPRPKPPAPKPLPPRHNFVKPDKNLADRSAEWVADNTGGCTFAKWAGGYLQPGCGGLPDGMGGMPKAVEQVQTKKDILDWKHKWQQNRHFETQTYFKNDNRTGHRFLKAGGLKWLGRAGLGFNVIGAIDTYNTEREDGKSRAQATTAGVANLAGALAGATAGAKLGAMIGVGGGPVGVLVGGAVGGAIGGIVGGGIGKAVVDAGFAGWRRMFG
jgi:RHS repeat-associated protein